MFALRGTPWLAAYARRAAQIFNRQGVPLYYKEWARELAARNQADEHKLMFGFLFSLKQLVAKMSPKTCARTRARARAAPHAADRASCVTILLAQRRRLLRVQHKRVQTQLLRDGLRTALRADDRLGRG